MALQPRPSPADPRNSFGGRSDALFRLYVASVIVFGGATVLYAATRLRLSELSHLGPAFWLVCGLLLFGELRPLFTSGARDSNGLLVSTAFVYALVLRYGLPVALVVVSIVTAVIDTGKRKAWWRTAFNIGQYGLAWSAAGTVAGRFGATGSPSHPAQLAAGQLVGAAAGGVVYFVLNQGLVTRAVSLKSGIGWWQLSKPDLAYEALTNGALIALAPLIVIAVDRGVAFVPLLVPPLVAVYKVASQAIVSEQQAMTDPLTGLPNRKLLALRTQEALDDPGCGTVALLLFDLDRFKEVNDTLGHHVGDRLLQVVGQRLSHAVKSTDTVARLGGDEFALLLVGGDGVDGSEGAAAAAVRLRAEIAAPIVLEGLLVDVGASVGVAVSPADGMDLDTLLRRADVAMYLAKETGTGVESYDSDRDRNSPSRLAMLGELRVALATDQLELHYQPTADLLTGAVVGVEALVRWRHPARGLVPPDDFVPLAERSGLIHALTAWVLDHAVAQLAVWRATGLELAMAVNVSVKDLSGGQLADQVAACLARHDVSASTLLLEVTEGSLFADPVRAAATLHQLDAMGVMLSLDDFGTGYSSLGQLRRLPVCEVKVDRSFVQRMQADPRDRAIVASIIDLALGLGMTVVAEGVEDQPTWELLAAMGCDRAQGWLLSRAGPAQVLTPWLVARSGLSPRRPVSPLSEPGAAPSPAR